MKNQRHLVPVLSLAALGLLAGCGAKNETSAAAPSAPATTAAAPSAPAAPAPAEVVWTINADDRMLFDAQLFEVRSGQTVRVVFTNKGTMPKQAMAHNWVLLKPCSDDDFMAFGLAAATAAPTYIPADQAKRVVASTKMLGPGESDTIDFTVPARPGTYPFLCSFPGHFSMMKGKVIVR